MSLSRGPSTKWDRRLSRKGSMIPATLRRSSSKKDMFSTVAEGLQYNYNRTLRPFEESIMFHSLHGPPLEDADFTSRPAVLLVGQYSTGKTTFIRYLLGEDFIGCRIGPEPTTDKFHVIMGPEDEDDRDQPASVIPGNALVVDPKLPFRPLAKFGNSFLNRFQCTRQTNPLLSEITLIDTPGILSGEKQNCDRGYDFVEVLEWFAARVDMVILLFDAHKLDISDELRRAIEALSRWDDKIRIVLNKCDGVDSQQLMRVYGALMWSLGKVLTCPEVPRVYIGSWWDKQLSHSAFRSLFELEEQDLFKDFRLMPRSAALRKLNDLIKRARLARVLALILGELYSSLPVFGKEAKKKQLLKHLESIVEAVETKHGTCTGDLPPMDKMRETLSRLDWSKFRPVDQRQMAKLDRMLTEEMSKLLAMLPAEVAGATDIVLNGPIEAVVADSTPFDPVRSLSSDRWRLSNAGQWAVAADTEKLTRWIETFSNAAPVDGKLTGAQAKFVMMQSNLPRSVLSKIWSLADIDRDGLLDEEEFCLCMYLIDFKVANNDLPSSLPAHLVPASKVPLLTHQEQDQDTLT